MTDKPPIRHGELTKRAIKRNATTIRAAFQKRYFKLFEVSMF